MTTVAFCNSGRPNTRSKTAAGGVLAENWRHNAASVPVHALWVAVEVDEGDLTDEHAIAKAAVGSRQIVGERYREILILGRGWELLDEQHQPAARGIPRQGPARDVHRARVRRRRDGRELWVVYGHFPTHAYNKPVVPAMRVEYDRMHQVTTEVVAACVAELDTVVLVDANNQHLPPVHPGQVGLNVHPPDYVLGIPTAGHSLAVAKQWSVPMSIEQSHQLRLATIQIRAATR